MELVSKVRDLYQTKVSDVRFLIPVLNGLNKSEVTKHFKYKYFVSNIAFNIIFCYRS